MKYMRTSLIMILVTITSILLGFIRESIVVSNLGVTWQADSFNFAVLLPSFLFATMGGVISTTFLPIYTDIRINKSTKAANLFASAFTNYILIICGLLVVLGEIFPECIVTFLAPGFKGDTYYMTLGLVRIVLPSLFFLGVTYSLIGVLESHQDIVISSFMTIPMHLAIIVSLMFIYPLMGLKWAMVNTIIGSIIQSLIVLMRVKKWRFKYTLSLHCDADDIRHAFKMIGPMLIGIMAMQINIMVDRMLASTLEAGSITSINLASKLNIASYSSIGYIVVLIIFPILSEYKSRDDMISYGETLNQGISIIIAVMIPITVLIIFFSHELIDILFGYGKFSSKDIKITSEILVCYSIGITALGIRDILNRGFYSIKDTKTPMKNSLISIVLNILINLALIRVFKAKGIAIATTISMIICSILLIKDMSSKIKSICIKNIFRNTYKIILSSIMLLITLICLKKIISISNIIIQTKIHKFIFVSVNSIFGICIYMLFLFLLKVDGLEVLWHKLQKIKLLRREKKYD